MEGPIAQTLSARIRDHILNGTFAAGQHLREVQLATFFGTSRTPVRHALAANEKDGLLAYTANRGFVVRAFDVMDIEQAYEMRALMEGYAARRAAERGLRADLLQMAAAAIESVAALLVQDAPLDDAAREVWRSRNTEFHQAIVAQAENRFLAPTLAIVRQIPSVFPPVLASYEASTLRVYNDQHRAVLASILGREGTRAEFLMREHVTLAGEAIRATVTTTTDTG
ncbi:MAG: GntR family transcriptional regulator [Janthinobacterium lividum]